MSHWHFAAILQSALTWVEARGTGEPSPEFLKESWDLLEPPVREAMTREQHDNLVRDIVALGAAG